MIDITRNAIDSSLPTKIVIWQASVLGMNKLLVKEVLQPPEFEGGYLFNTPGFQATKKGESKYFVLQKNSRYIARLCFRLVADRAFSGYQATFGSVDFDDNVDTDAAKYLIEQAVLILQRDGFKEIVIKHWPEAYGSGFHDIFLGLGFSLANREINQHLAVGNEEFAEIIKRNERKKLNQALSRGFTFRNLTVDDLPLIYQHVVETRKRKNYPVSMSYENLYQTILQLPDRYFLYGLYDREKLIAASVSVQVATDIIYNFYHADDFNYRSLSPLVLLIQHIYQYCQQQGVRILDLGISSADGVLNQGLYIFKENLGCEISDKNTYVLNNE
jgi:Acetyltransferase (GNAT) domain